MHVIEVEQLFKSYGSVNALSGLNLKIPKGSFYGLLGPNGAGKSTLLRIICTLLDPDSGKVKVGGVNALISPNEVRKILGYVAQEIAIDKILTGKELLELQADLYHLSRHNRDVRIEELIEQLDMGDWINNRCGTYSGGMKRRLDLATGLLHQPELLILDEPTVGLDIESRSAIWKLLLELRQQGTTILLSSHYLEEVDSLADQMAIIDKGRVIAEGSPEDLKRKLGGDRVTLRVSEFSNEKESVAIKDLLEGVTGVRKVVINCSQGFSLNLIVDKQEVINNIQDKLNDANMKIFSLSHSRPSLDDVYLQATGRTLLDAEIELAGTRDIKMEKKQSMR